MKKLREVLRLKFSAQLSHRMIADATNVSASTVSYYTRAAQELGLTWPIPDGMSDSELIKRLEPVAKQLSSLPARIEPDWAGVAKQMSKKHMTLRCLWEEYDVAHPKQAYSYAQFTRLYKAHCKKHNLSMRQEHKAGEKGFVDYAGTTIPVYNRQTGEVDFQAQLFVMALGLSHYTFAYATRSQALPDWIEAHVRAFSFYNGVPKVLVPDNLKSGVTDSCQFEPEANPTYADMAVHYDTTIIPARPYCPQDKAIVENAVLVSSRWIITRLAKNKYYSLQALNNAIAELLEALNAKAFQKRQGSRHSQFTELEQSQLIPLPSKPYEQAILKYQTLAKDYHVRIDGHYYSVPHQLVGQKVLCRYTQQSLEIIHNGQRVASHLRSFQRDGKTTYTEHMPKAHLNYEQCSDEVFLEWAQIKGEAVKLVTQEFVQRDKHPELLSKLYFGMKSLNKLYGAKRLNGACRRALALHCISYKSIKSILEKGLDQQPCLQALPSYETPEHENVRGNQYYQQ